MSQKKQPDLINLLKVVKNFHTLAARYNKYLTITGAGGSANVAAGILSRRTNIPYQGAHALIDWVGGESWYNLLTWKSLPMQEWHLLRMGEAQELPDLMAAAIKAAKRGVVLHA